MHSKKAFNLIGDLEIQVHYYAVEQRLGPNKCIQSVLVDMYGKLACTLEMSQVFNELDQMDVGRLQCSSYTCGCLAMGMELNIVAPRLGERYGFFRAFQFEMHAD